MLDPERAAFLRAAFAEILENTTDVFTTSISRLSLPEDSETNVSLKAHLLNSTLYSGFPVNALEF
jgi:hypothetical protein